MHHATLPSARAISSTARLNVSRSSSAPPSEAGSRVLLHPVHDLRGGAPRHDRVDQPVATAISKVRLSKAQAQQVVGVVRRVKIAVDRWAGDGARFRGIPLEHHHVLGGDYLLR